MTTAMHLQRWTSAISGVRRDRRVHSSALDDTAVVTAAYSDDKQPLDRAAASRGRYDAESDGVRRPRRPMPRSQSVSHINALASSSSSSSLARTESGSRFRQRLDALRGNLMARVRRKRSDVSTAKDDGTVFGQSGHHEVSVLHQPPSRTTWNGTDRSSVDTASSSPVPSTTTTTTVFDRRRVQRRTPRRHRTVVVGEQVDTARGLLRRNASSASTTTTTTDTTSQPRNDDVTEHQSSPRFVDVTRHQQELTSNVTDTVSQEHIQEFQLTR